MSHVDELFLLFRFSRVSGSWLGDLALQTPEDITVSRKLVRLWTNFAKTGKPTEGNILIPASKNSELKINFQTTLGNQLKIPRISDTP